MNIVNNVYKKSIDYQPFDSEVIYFGMGCFWGAEKLFGVEMAFMLQQLATLPAIQKTQHIKTYVMEKLIMLKLLNLFIIQKK